MKGKPRASYQTQAIFILFDFSARTLIGGYTFWGLLNDETSQLFDVEPNMKAQMAAALANTMTTFRLFKGGFSGTV